MAEIETPVYLKKKKKKKKHPRREKKSHNKNNITKRGNRKLKITKRTK